MGPSGSGKTSLLNTLAGRISSSQKMTISGTMRVGGKAVDPVSNRKNVAYVMQDTSLLPTVTPREALAFSAALRLPTQLSNEARGDLVETMLEELGLTECADVLVGGELITGISGGQRKRTSVGVDLITNPSMVFLDEPTSGLDSFSAHALVTLLKRVALAGSTVACTIHQPSSEVFDLFDTVILMREGRVVYTGETSSMTTYYAERGFPCPGNYNPADHVMFVMQSTGEAEMEKAGFFPKATGSTPRAGAIEGGEAHLPTPRLGFFEEASWLFQRELRHLRRDVGSLGARCGITLFLNLLFALIFQDSGREDDSVPENLNTHFGALTMVTISCMFGSALPTAIEFPAQRPVFLREYACGTYSALSYFLAKLCMEIPLAGAQILLAYVVHFWLIGFDGSFWFMFLASWGLAAASASVAVMLGSMVADVKTVSEMLSPIFVPQLLFAGFFIRIEQVPVYLRWAQWLCSLKYTMNLLVIAEFGDCDDAAKEGCDALLERNDVERDDWWIYVLIIIALFMAFRVVALIMLISKAKTVY